MKTPVPVWLVAVGTLGATFSSLPLDAQDSSTIAVPSTLLTPVVRTTLAVRVPASAPTSVEDMQAEMTVTSEAVGRMAAGDFASAWELIAADVVGGSDRPAVSPTRLGCRAAAVAGTLRNQDRLAEADRFAREVLARRWCDLDAIESATERAEVLYWFAWLAAEIVGDRKQALEWIAQADELDPDSDSILELRQRLVEAEISFPRN